MRKGLFTVGLALAATTLMVANAMPASANLVSPPTPVNNAVVTGTVTLSDDGANSSGINLLFTSCNGVTTITVRNSANAVVLNQSVTGTNGQNAPIPLTVSWVTDSVPNGVYTVTATNLNRRSSLCIGSGSTTTTTRTLTVQNTGKLVYGGDTSGATGSSALVKATLTDQNNIAPPANQTVTFALAGGNTVNGLTNASGQAQATLPITGNVGVRDLTVSYATGYYTSASITVPFTVLPAATTTTITPSLNPSTFGQSVSYTATITAAGSGVGTPTGSVQFLIDGSNFGGPVTVNGSGQAPSGPTATLAAGPHSVVANYTATGNFANSSGALTQTVNKAATTTSVTSSVNPSVYGQTITFTAAVAVVAPGVGTPTGNVTFQQNGQPIGGQVALDGTGHATSDPISVLTASPSPYTITVTYLGSGNFSGSSVLSSQTVNKANTSTSVVSSSAPSVFGQAVSFSSTVSAVAPGAGTPTGTVSYTVDGNALGGAIGLSGSAQANSPSIANLSPGDHTVAVTYSGDSNFNGSTVTFTQHVDRAETTTSLSSSVNPSVFGQSVTFTANVVPVAPGAGAPSGTVTFEIDGNPLGSPVAVVGGVATSDAIASLSVGGHSVVATYSGDPNFVGSADSLTQTVNKAATTTAVTSSVSPSVFGQTVTFDVTVSVTFPGAGTPSGTVSFFDGATLLDTQPLAGVANSGTASFSTAALSVGSHAISAVYSGDGNFLTSSGNVTQTVNKAQSDTTVAANGPIVQGQPVSFTAAVAAVAPGSGIPTGAVQFALNGAPQGGPVALDGTGHATSAPISGLTPGNFHVTATYTGDINFLPSSGGAGQLVSPGATSTSLVASPSPSAFGAPVTLTATVAVAPPAVGVATGSVDFYDGATLVGVGTLSNGGGGNQASVTISGLSVGVHNFSATYVGDFNFAGSSVGPVAHTVQGDPTSTALVSSPNPSTFNAPVTLTATATPSLANANPMTGTMSFFDGASLIGTAPVNAGGTASISVSNLSVGAHGLKATYSGDSTYGSSTSPTASHTVNKAQPSIATSRSNSNLTAVLSTPQGPLGGQTLVFKTGSTTICTVVTGANGGAGCTATGAQTLQITLNGSYTVSYNGNANYLPAQGIGH